jgi:hypothetical protein
LVDMMGAVVCCCVMVVTLGGKWVSIESGTKVKGVSVTKSKDREERHAFQFHHTDQ